MVSLSDLLKDAVEISHQPLASGLLFGESPRYHGRDGRLYVSDMIGQKIYCVDAKNGQKDTVLEVESQPNGIGFHPDGSLVYSSMFDAKLYKFDLRTRQSTLYADLSKFMTGYCGDMVIDRHGRVYIDDTGAGVAADGLHFPNGCAIDSTEKIFYLSESFSHRLITFEIDTEGRLSNRTTVWDMNQLTDAPRVNAIDGLCIDAEDGLWLSLIDHHVYVRRDKQGVFTHYIKADGEPIACALGGDDGKTLFMATNTWDKGSIFEAMMNKATRGAITTARVEVGKGKGLP
ncbi:SMP-30/Gluconolaconase/LRE-like domain-containing protein [Cladophialophora immunda]|nr:SMP-30/Gluconolaconase/LRE-like domain-containing protein [Cladophialophora immunda]